MYKLVPHHHPFPHLIIENTFDNHELELIWQELDFLTYSNKFDPPSKTSSATDNLGNTLKSNGGIFLDSCYYKREISNILTTNRKLFEKDILQEFAKLSFGYNQILHCNQDFTLLSYYEDSDYYLPHQDVSLFTILTWFYKTPKSFRGGDLIFSEYDYQTSIKNNITLFFPSYIQHSVTKVEMIHTYPKFSGYGRYCMSNFLHFKV
jgi:hypothetical protein